MNSATDPYRLGLAWARVWGNEEYVPFSPQHVSISPADAGDSIRMREIAVFLADDGFHVVWNGKVQHTFKHRCGMTSWSFRKFEARVGDESLTTCTTGIQIKDMTLELMVRSMGMELEMGSNTSFEHQKRVKVGNIKEFISTVLEVPELTKQEFDKWYKLRGISGTQWKTILPVILSKSKERRSLQHLLNWQRTCPTLFTVAKKNCEALLCMREEGVLLELVLENSMPLLVSVVFSGAIRQFARESQSRDHRRESRAEVLAAVFERLACSIVGVQLMQPQRSLQLDYTRTAFDEEMDEALEFATIHRMKDFISEPVIVSHVNNRWSDSGTNLVAGVEKWIPPFLNNLSSTSKNNFFLWYLQIIPFCIYVIVCAFPLFLLTSR
jgi:hypothetical protein